MKCIIKYEWNDYASPPKPWCSVRDPDGNLLASGTGESWDEAKKNALDKALHKAVLGPVPLMEEVEM